VEEFFDRNDCNKGLRRFFNVWVSKEMRILDKLELKPNGNNPNAKT
jgi:hypothetical protein